MAKQFRVAAHELLELLDVQSPTVSRLKVMIIHCYKCTIIRICIVCVCLCYLCVVCVWCVCVCVCVVCVCIVYACVFVCVCVFYTIILHLTLW